MSSPVGTHSDALRLQLSGVDVPIMRVFGTMPGIIVLAASGYNGPRTGTITVGSAGIAWNDGTPAPATPDGEYLLEASDADDFIRVMVYNDYLPASGQATIDITDSYNVFGPADVTAVQATAGYTVTTQYTIKNISPLPVGVTIVSAIVPNLLLGTDGVNFSNSSVVYSGIVAGASVNLYVQETTSAGAIFNPQILNATLCSWQGA
jgi:hypothetical protein